MMAAFFLLDFANPKVPLYLGHARAHDNTFHATKQKVVSFQEVGQNGQKLSCARAWPWPK